LAATPPTTTPISYNFFRVAILMIVIKRRIQRYRG
jgi:hypothetical protein